MNRNDFKALAQALHIGYASLHKPEEKTGFNKAIHSVIAACSELNPQFDAVRFAVAIYDSQTSATRYARTHRPHQQ